MTRAEFEKLMDEYIEQHLPVMNANYKTEFRVIYKHDLRDYIWEKILKLVTRKIKVELVGDHTGWATAIVYFNDEIIGEATDGQPFEYLLIEGDPDERKAKTCTSGRDSQ